MALYGQFDKTFIDATGNAKTGVIVTIYREGATVNGAQNGIASGAPITVHNRGAIAVGDTVIRQSTLVTYTVSATTLTTITLSGFGGTIDLADDERFTPGNNLPPLREERRAGEAVTNPMPATGSKGRAMAWLAGGTYDYAANDAGVITWFVDDISARPEFAVNITDAPFYAKCDGVTDDRAAIQAAIDYLAANDYGGGTVGGLVLVPPGVTMIGAPLVLANKVSIMGVGPGLSCELKALPGFSFNGTTGAMVQIGAVGSATNHFDCRVINLTLNCAGVANSIGLYSDNCNEGSGWEQMRIRQAALKGVFLDGTAGGGSCRNMHCTGLQIGITTATGIGFHLKSVTEQNTFNDISISAAGTTPTTSKGIFTENTGHGVFHGVHAEFLNLGVDLGTGFVGSVHGLTGTGNVLGMARLNDESQGIFDITPAGGSAIIIDNSGLTGNTSPITSFDGSFYKIGARHADAKASVWTDFYSTGAGAPTTRATQLVARVHERKEFLGQLTFTRQTIASAATIDGTLFANRGFMWTLTGSTAISNITTDGSDDCRLLILKVGGGHTATVVTGGNIILPGGNWAPATTDEILVLVSDGTNYREVCRSGAQSGVTQTVALTSAAQVITVNNDTTYLRLTIANAAFAGSHSGGFVYNTAFNGRLLTVYVENNDAAGAADPTFDLADSAPFKLTGAFNVGQNSQKMIVFMGDGVTSTWNEITRATLL